MKNTDICAGSVITLITNKGVAATLREYPELRPYEMLLEQIAAAQAETTWRQHLLSECEKHMDLLGAELSDLVDALQP